MSEWERPTQPPSPMFFGEKEKNLVKQVNDEIIERPNCKMVNPAGFEAGQIIDGQYRAMIRLYRANIGMI